MVEECMGGVVLCVGGSTSDLWEDGKTREGGTKVVLFEDA